MNLLVRSIFCPNQEHYEKSFEGILNLFDNLNENAGVSIYIIGWCKYAKYKDNIKKLLNTNKIKVYFDFLAFNYGKLFMYKKMSEFIKNHNEFKSIIYTDHDIIFQDDIIYYFNTLNASANNIILNGTSIGIIFLNQSNDNRHQSSIYDNVIYSDGKMFVYPNENDICSVASGAFYITRDCLSSLESINVNIVYGMDEYFLLNTILKNGYRFVISHDLKVVHPYTEDKKYVEWKISNIKDIINKINNNQSIDYNYNNKILESHNFWS